jgi:hypothetical protein
LLVIGLALVALYPAAARGAETRYSLAGGCFAVKAAGTGMYISRDGRRATWPTPSRSA